MHPMVLLGTSNHAAWETQAWETRSVTAEDKPLIFLVVLIGAVKLAQSLA